MLEKKLAQRILAQARTLVLEGKLQRAEGGSQITIASAIQLFIEMGILNRGDGGTIKLGSERVREELLEKLSSWLTSLS